MQRSQPQPHGPLRRSALVLGAVLLGGAIWLGLTGGEPTSLLVGAPTVLIAVALAARYHAARFMPRPLAVPGFLAFFLWQQLCAAGFIAVCVMRPRLDLEPGTVSHRLRLHGDGPRALMMGALTLMPGTLAAMLEGDTLCVHALDRRVDVAGDLDRLETRIARLFGQALDGPAAV